MTGLQIKSMKMEQYRIQCPVHGIPFQGERLCPKCNFVWQPQNYVTTPDTLWWDGFADPEGNVRQFFFTSDMARSMPEHLIGEDNTVPAFGFSFFHPVNPLPPRHVTRGGGDKSVYLGFDDDKPSHIFRSISMTKGITEPKVGVGAGARIRQKLTLDNHPLDYYRPDPVGRIILWFVFEEQFRKIVSVGVRNLKGDNDGFMRGGPTGQSKG
ncbi:MAG: hypothetical protein ABIH52_03375 [Candidatus Aenigmatarchaeota archaeon]